MRSPSSRLLLLPLLVVAMAATSDTDPSAARASADVVLVREGETVDEDLYAGGNTITIEGVIEGDLVVWAYDRLDVTGTVEGDIFGYASTASVRGSVGGSVRLAGINIDVAGETGGDVFAIGWNVTSSGDVGRDVLVWANRLVVDGTVGRDVEGQTLTSTTVGGTIGRDFEMTVDRLLVRSTAVITEDLVYQSSTPAVIEDGAVIGGTQTQRSPTIPNIQLSAIRMVALVLGMLAFVWMGMLAIWLMPATMQEATSSVWGEPFRSLIVGIVAFLTPVILAGSIIAIAALSPPELALTVMGLGAPIWIGLLVLLTLGAMVAPVPVAISVGRRILGRRRSAFAAYLLGIVLFIAVLFVPWIGGVVALVVGLTGLGALARGAIRARGSLGWTVGQVSERRRRRVGGPKRLIEPEEGEGDWMAEDDDEDDDLPPRPHLAPVEDEDEDAD